MTREEFWEKWIPCDRPPIEPSQEMKDGFMGDLEDLIGEAVDERLAKFWGPDPDHQR